MQFFVLNKLETKLIINAIIDFVIICFLEMSIKKIKIKRYNLSYPTIRFAHSTASCEVLNPNRNKKIIIRLSLFFWSYHFLNIEIPLI